MEQKRDMLYPSAPVENNDFKKRLEKKLNVFNNFINHISNIKEIITYFKDKMHGYRYHTDLFFSFQK